jgi:hypothetical protein
MNATWRLTDRGKRLYWLYRAFTHIELTPIEFIEAIVNEQILHGGCCLSCGEQPAMLVSLGLFCVPCIGKTYEKAA